MNLIDEAVIIEVFGIRMYAFGAYAALGALCAFITLLVVCRTLRMKPGTAPLSFLCSGICGILFSRLFFCLMNQELGMMMPLDSWFNAAGGGWSMFGLISGVFLGGWISAAVIREKPGKVFDVLSLSLLPLMIAERIGENRIEDFDISRMLETEFFAKSFLAAGEDERWLMTYYLAAGVYLVLFAIILFLIFRSRRDGDTAVSFLLLLGAASIVLESLRYDFFLSISFVRLQQVAAALMLALGVILAIRRSNGQKRALAIAAGLSLPLMVGAVIGLEFALDRTTWNKILIYAAMIVTVAVPAALGLRLLRNGEKGIRKA